MKQLAIFAILLTCAHNICANFELLIVHSNDLRCRLEEGSESGKKVGGMARVSYVVNEARKLAAENKGPPVLYLNAGDIYTDAIWQNPFSQKVAIEFLNILKPDVACFGSHDLDYGIENIRSFVHHVKFPLIAANIYFGNTTHMSNIIKASVVFTIQNRKIGVIGYITPNNHLFKSRDRVYFEDEVEAVRREANRLKRDKVNIIIALGYSGISVDKTIARKVRNVDIVVGGLTNTLLWNGKAPFNEKVSGPYPKEIIQPSGKKVLLVTTYGFTKYIGRLKVTFNDNNVITDYEGHPLFLDSNVPYDPTILHMFDIYDPSARQSTDDARVLGNSVVFMSADKVRDEESNLANFILDCFVEFMANKTKTSFWTDVPIAVMNAGAIRKSIPTSKDKPNITKPMLIEVLPFRQRLVVLNLLGSSIMEALETGVASNGETRGGEFLQVSGIRVSFDYSKPSGNRVVQARTFCSRCPYPLYEHIDPNKHYKVIVNTFLANGGDGHITFKRKTLSVEPIEAYEMDVITALLKFYGNVRPECEERITYTTKYRRVAISKAETRRSNYESTLLLSLYFTAVIKILSL